MGIFENSFFSVAGQLERLANVGNTLVAAVTGKGVQSNTGIKVVDQVLSTAASNPFSTAAIAATVVNPAGAVNAVKSVFTALPTSAKVISIVATPVVVGAVVENPKIAVEAAKTPSKLANFGSNASALLANPSVDNLKTLVKENPVIAAGTALAGAAVVGGGLGLAANTAATYFNTQSTNKNTQPAEITVPKGSDPMEYMQDWIKQQQKAMETNKQDVQIAEIQAKAQKEANEAAIEIAKLQVQPVNNAISTPTAAPLTPSKVVKKTTKKKKKATPKKKKKATKKKKKAKTIKRKKKKR